MRKIYAKMMPKYLSKFGKSVSYCQTRFNVPAIWKKITENRMFGLRGANFITHLTFAECRYLHTDCTPLVIFDPYT